ncbi:MAG: phosphoribosylformimino-5-aminoimidazole carboxamide ribotide isomerase [Lentisphaerae bacterium RIFOXYB12_FULL_65_16]|nr:MAG: phosphoribosylformimino-5-aminoimidazole carboxamide ribotide isomerase [Lentisphaerae bacterium RIFOXYA12_64_32]OGV86462.1 MAG: phosphoribosylformimino-5-aminoimidazole carboxamide ribotide isomerase [Lentisphaerae bacterium RIFOXYB12_FULL_65_16]
MRFRPCIDLHQGKVKQIVGSSLRDDSNAALVTNFVADRPASYFADMYRCDGLVGGHVILLGPGNDDAAVSALRAHPGGLQVGGGMTPDNAVGWLAKGAAKVIVTSYVFQNGALSSERLRRLVDAAGAERLVLDLSCRRRNGDYVVVIDRWQTFTDVILGPRVFAELAMSCSEFLIHAVDVEGKQAGVDGDLVRAMAAWSPVPATYAGGVRSLADISRIEELGQGRVDVTVGSALDIFGGSLSYRELVNFDRQRRPT